MSHSLPRGGRNARECSSPHSSFASSPFSSRFTSGDSTDDDDLFYEEHRSSCSRFAQPRYILAASLGLASLIACAPLFTQMMLPPADTSRRGTTVRQLLDSPEMTDAATSNFLQFGGAQSDQMSHNDWETLHRSVGRGLKSITRKMQASNPDRFKRLDSVELKPEQASGLVKVVRGLSDQRVQHIGYEVVKIVHAGMAEGEDAQGVKRRLLAKFQPRLRELRALRDELIPLSLRHDDEAVAQSRGISAGVSTSGALALNLDRMHIVKMYAEIPPIHAHRSQQHEKDQDRRLTGAAGSGGERDAISAMLNREIALDNLTSMHKQSTMKKWEPKIERGLGVIAGLIEQVRVVLDQTDFIGESFGKDMKIPFWTKSLIGAIAFFTEMGDCILRANDHNGTLTGDKYNHVKLFMCPMKYASSFMDLISAIDNILGVANDDWHKRQDAIASLSVPTPVPIAPSSPFIPGVPTPVPIAPSSPFIPAMPALPAALAPVVPTPPPMAIPPAIQASSPGNFLATLAPTPLSLTATLAPIATTAAVDAWSSGAFR